MRTLLKVVGVLVALLVVGVGALMAVGTTKIGQGPDVPAHAAPTPASDSIALERGARVAGVFQCTTCHADDLGGTDFLDGGPFMTLPAPNLTGGRFTDDELEMAVRHGVGSDGHYLVIMPSDAFAQMSDEDMAALLGFIRSKPAVERRLIDRSVGPVGRAVAAFQAPDLQPARRIEVGASHATITPPAERYYAPLCQACHGQDLGGMVFAGEAPVWAPNLTPHSSGLGDWTFEEFDQALRHGQNREGRELDPMKMPWQGFQSLRDEEVRAIWSYLQGLGPIEREAPEI